VLTEPEQPWEPYALEVLAGVLDGGTSARLETELVRGQAVATSVGAGYDAYNRLQTLFTFAGTPSNGNSVATLEKALQEQIDRVRETRVSEQEMDRVKAKIRAGKVYEQDSIFYQAMQIGVLETIGLNWKELERYYEYLDAVTPEQVQAVARKYLTDDRLTVAELVPLPIDPDHPPRSGGVGDVH
jgi:zinc protease